MQGPKNRVELYKLLDLNTINISGNVFLVAQKLSENDLLDFIIVRKVAGENPANKSGTTADRRGCCFHQLQNET
jgi:hypothetical protein